MFRVAQMANWRISSRQRWNDFIVMALGRRRTPSGPAIGPALQSVGVSGGYYLFNAMPYVLTLIILVATCSTSQSLKGAPMELGVSR